MKKLKSILGSLAPTLGAAIGGPLGGQAGQILSQVLGVPNNQNSIEQAMNNITAEQMIELKKAETDFEVRMRELDVDVFRLETEDVKDARQKFSNDWTPKVLGLVSMFGFMAYIFFITAVPIDDASDDIVMLIIGSLTGIATAVISFYFGSSNKKDQK
jgi:Fe2+ transport system protein B